MKVYLSRISNVLKGLNLDDDMDEDEMCHNFRAADFRYSRNRREIKDETRIFGIFCARHSKPLFFIDLFRGGKFGYCDHLIARVLQDCGEERQAYLFFACKYSVKFQVRTQWLHSLGRPNPEGSTQTRFNFFYQKCMFTPTKSCASDHTTLNGIRSLDS